MKNHIIKFILSVFFTVFFTNCGLDVFYILEPPVFIRTSVEDDPIYRYYSFRTQEVANTVAEYRDIFLGTEIYYKLYNSRSSMLSDQSLISGANTANSQNGADRMISSLNYQKMMLKDQPREILIEKTGENRDIELRLYPEGDKSDVENGNVDPTLNSFFKINTVNQGVPVRYNNRTFYDVDNFTGADVDSATGDSRDKWYINAYAVSTGMNTEMQTFYSQVVHLGAIYVEKKY